MHVWLIKLEESLPIDSDYRPYRMGMLAEKLVEAGHTVTRWASDYNHLNHHFRQGKTGLVTVNNSYQIHLIHQLPAYKNTVSLNRIDRKSVV